MTTYYLRLDDDEQVRELSFGRCPEVVQDMCRTLLDWETEASLRENAARPDPPKRKARTRKKPA